MATETKTYKVTHTDDEWRRILTPEQYAVMRKHGTERPGSCALLHEKRAGTFVCAGCGEPLFEGQVKFESGTGWPSFNTPVEGAVETTTDRSLGMTRTDAEWRKLLTAEQYGVMRQHGTERPGSCALLHEKRAGTGPRRPAAAH